MWCITQPCICTKFNMAAKIADVDRFLILLLYTCAGHIICDCQMIFQISYYDLILSAECEVSDQIICLINIFRNTQVSQKSIKVKVSMLEELTMSPFSFSVMA